MRKDINPAKATDMPAAQPQPLGIVTLTNVPVMTGYHEQLLDIFYIHLASVYEHTPSPFDFIAFDNAICPEFVQALTRLHQADWITTLILSGENMGKNGGQSHCYGAVANEWLCFTDSDMLFRPGWLAACEQIHATFPKVGLAVGQVVYPDLEIDKDHSGFEQWAGEGFVFSKASPEDWIAEEYARGRGIPADIWENLKNMPLDQVTATQSGVKAYIGGNSHQHFFARREVIQKLLPLKITHQLNRLADSEIDQHLDALGYVRLTTTQPYVYHMGNVLDKEIKPEIDRLTHLEEIRAGAPKSKVRPFKSNSLYQLLFWLSQFGWTKQLLLRLYNNLFQIFSNRG